MEEMENGFRGTALPAYDGLGRLVEQKDDNETLGDTSEVQQSNQDV
jgi:hypothetical protein